MVQTESQGAVRVFSVVGQLNREEADALRGSLEAEPSVGRPQWVIDMSEVPLIDSAGCEALLDAWDTAHRVGGSVHLAGLTALCRDVLAVTYTLANFPTFDTVSQAVAQYAR